MKVQEGLSGWSLAGFGRWPWEGCREVVVWALRSVAGAAGAAGLSLCRQTGGGSGCCRNEIVSLQNCNTHWTGWNPDSSNTSWKAGNAVSWRDVAPHVTKIKDSILIWRKKNCLFFDCESCLAAVPAECVLPLGPAAVCSAVPLLGIWLLLGHLGSSSKAQSTSDSLEFQSLSALPLWLMVSPGILLRLIPSVSSLSQTRKKCKQCCLHWKLCLQISVSCQISISWVYSFPECCAVSFSVPKKCQKAREHFGTVRTQMESLKTKFPADQYYRCAGSHTARHRYMWEFLGHLASLLWNNDVKTYGLNASFSLKSKSW